MDGITVNRGNGRTARPRPRDRWRRHSAAPATPRAATRTASRSWTACGSHSATCASSAGPERTRHELPVLHQRERALCPRRVLCVNCLLRTGAASPLFIDLSVDSGARRPASAAATSATRSGSSGQSPSARCTRTYGSFAARTGPAEPRRAARPLACSHAPAMRLACGSRSRARSGARLRVLLRRRRCARAGDPLDPGRDESGQTDTAQSPGSTASSTRPGRAVGPSTSTWSRSRSGPSRATRSTCARAAPAASGESRSTRGEATG